MQHRATQDLEIGLDCLDLVVCVCNPSIQEVKARTGVEGLNVLHNEFEASLGSMRPCLPKKKKKKAKTLDEIGLDGLSTKNRSDDPGLATCCSLNQSSHFPFDTFLKIAPISPDHLFTNSKQRRHVCFCVRYKCCKFISYYWQMSSDLVTT